MAKGSVRADSGRMSYGSGKPVLGRKFCSSCGKWRHLCDYNAAKRTRGFVVQFSHICKTCARLKQREYFKDPQVRERQREYDRFWHDAQRRKAGIPERNWVAGGARDKSPANGVEAVVDATLFLRWLDQWKAENTEGGFAALAKAAGFSDRSLRRVRESGRVSRALIDRVLVAADSPTGLWELTGD